MDHLINQTECYIDWLLVRGLSYPPHVYTREMPPQDLLSPVLSAPEEGFKNRIQNYSSVEKASPTWEKHPADTVFIMPKVPEGPSLHMLTKIMRALDIKDNSFRLWVWQQHFDPGQILEELGDYPCQQLIILDDILSELLLDQNFHDIRFKSFKTPFGFKALAAPAIESIISQPELKRPLWKGLLDVFDTPKH